MLLCESCVYRERRSYDEKKHPRFWCIKRGWLRADKERVKCDFYERKKQ